MPTAALADALAALDPAVRRGARGRARQRPPVAEASSAAIGTSSSPQGQTRPGARGAGAPRGRLRARRPGAVPVARWSWASRRRGPPGVEEVVVCAVAPGDARPPARCAAPTRSTRWAAPRRSPRSPTGPRPSRPVDVIVGPGSLYAQEAKRQVFGVGRHRRLRRAERPRRHRVGAAPSPPGRARRCSRRPSTATDTLVVAVSDDETCSTTSASSSALLDAPERRGRAVRAGPAPTWRPRCASARRFAPEHLQLIGAEAEALAPRVRTRGLRLRRRRRRDRVRRLRRGLEPRPAHRGRRALRLRR